MNLTENIEKIITLAKEKSCKVLENEPLSKHTTFKIGGNAAAMISIDTINVLSELFAKCNELEVPNFVIGNGSNLLISDQGYNGVVFKLDGDFKNISLIDENTIMCGCGVSLAKLCRFALDNNLSGLEFAWGIPGSVGGAAFMNAGAYGGEMKDVMFSSSYISTDGTLGRFTAEEMDLSYRRSIYSENKYIITSIIVKLKPDDHDLIRERMDDFMQRRKDKQPLEYPSAGSVFKRPVGYFAGGLIEQCNLKGVQIGGAQVSVKHAGFIINTGNATCEDVCNLVKHIQNVVLENTGVQLECEIKKV